MFNATAIIHILFASCLFFTAASCGAKAAATACKPGKGYVLYANDHGRSDASSNLYVLNLYLHGAAPAYPLDLGETGIREITDIAFLPDGRLFGVTFTRLVAIDTVTKSAKFIGDSIGAAYLNEERWINALAASSDGRLYAATRDGELLTIDTESGEGTPVGVYGHQLGSSGDLAFLPDGTLMASAKRLDAPADTTDLLVRVDRYSGQAELVGDIGFKEVFGLASGRRDELFGVADGNGLPKLIRINRYTGKGMLIAPLPDSDGMWGMISRDLCASVANTNFSAGSQLNKADSR